MTCEGMQKCDDELKGVGWGLQVFLLVGDQERMNYEHIMQKLSVNYQGKLEWPKWFTEGGELTCHACDLYSSLENDMVR